MLVGALLCTLAHETAGAARAPAFPAPSEVKRGKRSAKLRAHRAARIRALVPSQLVIAREGGRSSIPQTPIRNRECAAYWFPACAGMTIECGATPVPRERLASTSWGHPAHPFSVVSR